MMHIPGGVLILASFLIAITISYFIYRCFLSRPFISSVGASEKVSHAIINRRIRASCNSEDRFSAPRPADSKPVSASRPVSSPELQADKPDSIATKNPIPDHSSSIRQIISTVTGYVPYYGVKSSLITSEMQRYERQC
jgi:hypothetical protein